MKIRGFLKSSERSPLHLNVCSLLLLSLALLLSPAEGYAVQKPGADSNASEKKIAVFTFENLTEESGALNAIMPSVKSVLQREGFELLDEAGLDQFLIRERVRTTGYINSELAQKMRNEFGVSAVLLGNVFRFSADSNPQLGLSARLVDSSTGAIIWSNYASATGDDFSGLLGLGRLNAIEELLPKVINRLFAGFSAVPPSLKEKESTITIAVMPFLNKTTVPGAGMIPTYMFLVELFKNPVFVPLEYGDIRKVIEISRIRDKGEVEYKSIGEIAGDLKADVILVGAIEKYSDGRDTSSAPEVVISARLIDARKNRIVWCDSSEMNGDDNISVLDWGKLRSVDKVAYRVVEQLAKRMGKTLQK
jgi:TolB-like protein